MSKNPMLTRRPTLTQLSYLLAIAEHGHFGRAAEASFVTQSTISASLKELEETLGGLLIERTRRSVHLTPLGEEVTKRARKLLRDTDDIVDLAAHAGAPLSGTLRLGVIPTIAPFLLPRVLPKLRKAWPDLKLYIREDTSANLITALGKGTLDLLILAFPFDTTGFETQIFATDPFFLAFPRNHDLKKKERVSFRDFKSEPLLLLEHGHCLRDHVLAGGHLTLDPSFEATSLHTLVQMVDNGLGLTLLPKMALDAGITRGTRIETRPLDGRGTSRTIGFSWRKTSSGQTDFEILSEFFEEELATPLPRRRRS